tara:strand:+ start:3274 stop:3732 length:459 start_codon:yes stop_codon:yes gene_type:complete
MSDFDGVDFFENIEQMESKGPEVAPTGVYQAKVVAAEKYKSQSGNWTQKMTFQIDGGKYRDHNEWYNLWSPSEEPKRIASEIFTRLAKAVGFKKLPELGSEFIGKNLQLKLTQYEDAWTDGDGNQRTSYKNKINLYEPAEILSPSPEAKPPF